MKELVLSIMMACLMSISAMAQTAEFMGISLYSDMQTFCDKLKSKDFELIDEDEDCKLYTGTFNGEQVFTLVEFNSDKRITMVSVYLPAKSTWVDVLSEFEKYNEIYTAQYDEPLLTARTFDELTPGTPAFHAGVESGTVHYYNLFDIDDEFSVSIKIEVDQFSDPSDGYLIRILYFNVELLQ